jgi:hypothetical protein
MMKTKFRVTILSIMVLWLCSFAFGQADQIPELNITLAEQRVVFAPTRSFQEMRLEVLNSNGESVFSYFTTEATFAWNLRAGNGETLTPGLYRYVLTLKLSEERMRQHSGHFIVERGQDQIWLTANDGTEVSGTTLQASRTGGRSLVGRGQTNDPSAGREVSGRTVVDDQNKKTDDDENKKKTDKQEKAALLGTVNMLAKFDAGGTNVIDSAAIETGGNLGLGTTSPNAKLSVSANTGAPPSAPGIIGYFVSGNESNTFLTADSYGNSNIHSDFLFRRARGAMAAPAAVAADDIIGQIQARGHGTTGFAPTSRAGIRMTAAQNWTDAAQGAFLSFLTTPNGSNAINVERMRITDAGNVGIGTTTPASKLDVAGAVNTTTHYNILNSRVLGLGPNGLNTFVGITAGGNTSTGSANSFFGNQAGVSNTTGSGNSFFGNSAGAGNNADGNSFFGQAAGQTNTTGNFNSFFGYNAGNKNTIGTNNSYFGDAAGLANITGNNNAMFGSAAGVANLASGNTFVGSNSGRFNTTGNHNSFFGWEAGKANTTADANSFFGALAGRSNTTGTWNSFFGTAAGWLNTTGISNSFFGTNAGEANTTGANNSFFGDRAGTVANANNNSFFGKDAGSASTTGGENTFIGAEAGLSNTTGFLNVMVGWRSGKSSTTGVENTFAGVGAGESNTTGSSNTLVGRAAGSSNAAGIRNSFYGYLAGHDTVGGISGGEFPEPFGHSNTFAGAEAGKANTNGSFNTFVGDIAGITNTNGIRNTFLGYNARGNAGSFNATAVGSDALANCNSCVILGHTSARVGIGTSNPNAAYKLDVAGSVNASGGYFQVSDQNYKQNIRTLFGALDKVRHLRGVSYQWNRVAFPAMQFNDRLQLGFIAQEVEQVLPEAVTKDSQGKYSMSYTALVPLLTEAIKEQQQQFEQTSAQKEQQINQLIQQNAVLEERLKALEQQMRQWLSEQAGKATVQR